MSRFAAKMSRARKRAAAEAESWASNLRAAIKSSGVPLYVVARSSGLGLETVEVFMDGGSVTQRQADRVVTFLTAVARDRRRLARAAAKLMPDLALRGIAPSSRRLGIDLGGNSATAKRRRRVLDLWAMNNAEVARRLVAEGLACGSIGSVQRNVFNDRKFFQEQFVLRGCPICCRAPLDQIRNGLRVLGALIGYRRGQQPLPQIERHKPYHSSKRRTTRLNEVRSNNA